MNNKELLALLSDWLQFSEDVSTDCAAGQDWLEHLRLQTKIVINELNRGGA